MRIVHGVKSLTNVIKNSIRDIAEVLHNVWTCFTVVGAPQNDVIQ